MRKIEPLDAALLDKLMRESAQLTSQVAPKKLKKSESLRESADRAGVTPRDIETLIMTDNEEGLKTLVKGRLASGRVMIPGMFCVTQPPQCRRVELVWHTCKL